MTGIWYSTQGDLDEESYIDGDPGCFTCDAERAAAGVARADGKNYALLSATMRERYLELAIGALEALGLERDS